MALFFQPFPGRAALLAVRAPLGLREGVERGIAGAPKLRVGSLPIVPVERAGRNLVVAARNLERPAVAEHLEQERGELVGGLVLRLVTPIGREAIRCQSRL